MGYLIAIIGQFIALVYLYLFAATSLSFLIGGYLLLMAFIGDTEHTTKLIDKKAKSKDPLRISKQFCRAIELHAIVKELSETKKVFHRKIGTFLSH